MGFFILKLNYNSPDNEAPVVIKIGPSKTQVTTATIGTPATGATFITDVNIVDTTIFTTQANRPTIASGAYSSVAGTAANNKFALGDIVVVDIDKVGTEIPGEDLTIGIWVDFDY